jgi:hypothetical protein
MGNAVVPRQPSQKGGAKLARSVFCARLPVTAAMLDPIIAFLNDKNREYAEGEADYNWSAWADNCSHTMRNALAAANIWSPLSVRTIKILSHVLYLFGLQVTYEAVDPQTHAVKGITTAVQREHQCSRTDRCALR